MAKKSKPKAKAAAPKKKAAKKSAPKAAKKASSGSAPKKAAKNAKKAKAVAQTPSKGKAASKKASKAASKVAKKVKAAPAPAKKPAKAAPRSAALTPSVAKKSSAAARSAPRAQKPAQGKASGARLPVPAKAVRKGRQAAINTPQAPKAKRSVRSAGSGPLQDVTVLELSTGHAGQMAGMILAGFGARVIKVEPPDGDPGRSLEPQLDGLSAQFRMLNRGKKSLALETQSKKGKEIIARVAADVDIVIETVGAPNRPEVGSKPLLKANPSLVYVAISGYGLSGPYAGRAASEVNYMAMAGALELLGGESGLPAVPGIQLAEFAGGALPAVIGALIALHTVRAGGQGQVVDVSTFDGLIGLLALPMADYGATRRKARYGQEPLFGQYACYNVYPARNSRWLAVGALDPTHWAELCKALDRVDLIEDQFADGDRQQVVVAELTRAFQRKEVREWMELFEGKSVCVTEVRNVSDVAHDEHLIEREVVAPVKGPEGPVPVLGAYPKLTGTPGGIHLEPPLVGADSDQVLEGAGFSKKDIEGLRKSKTVAGG